MTDPTGEVTALRNERDFPYFVQIAVPESGFGRTLDLMVEWHRAYGFKLRYGRRQRIADCEYARWCFTDAWTAEEFRARFGGEVLWIPPL
jgi:hypothetical protein